MEIYRFLPKTETSLCGSTLKALRSSLLNTQRPLLNALTTRVDVLKLAIGSAGNVFIHTGAAIGKIAVGVVQFPLHSVWGGVTTKLALTDALSHMAYVARSMIAAILVPLPALVNPNFSITAYRWLALEKLPEGILANLTGRCTPKALLGLAITAVTAAGFSYYTARMRAKFEPGLLGTVSLVSSSILMLGGTAYCCRKRSEPGPEPITWPSDYRDLHENPYKFSKPEATEWEAILRKASNKIEPVSETELQTVAKMMHRIFWMLVNPTGNLTGGQNWQDILVCNIEEMIHALGPTNCTRLIDGCKLRNDYNGYRNTHPKLSHKELNRLKKMPALDKNGVETEDDSDETEDALKRPASGPIGWSPDCSNPFEFTESERGSWRTIRPSLSAENEPTATEFTIVAEQMRRKFWMIANAPANKTGEGGWEQREIFDIEDMLYGLNSRDTDNVLNQWDNVNDFKDYRKTHTELTRVTLEPLRTKFYGNAPAHITT